MFGPENFRNAYYLRIWKPWKCSLFSDLKTVEVFTVFGSEDLGSVHSFRIWKPLKCSLFSDLKTVEVFTVFGSETPGSVHYFRIWKPWKCILVSDLKTLEVSCPTQFCRRVRGAKLPRKAGWLWGPLGPPTFAWLPSCVLLCVWQDSVSPSVEGASEDVDASAWPLPKNSARFQESGQVPEFA